jgi:prepilin-type N-terminal cleavage/methylation domain-containing protein
MGHNGFSLTELMLGLLIGAIVILMIGSLSQVSVASYQKLRGEGGANDDAYHALDQIQREVRQTTGSISVSGGSSLTVGTYRFYIQGNSLVYDDSSTGAFTQPLIFGICNLAFQPSVSADQKTVTIRLRGGNLVTADPGCQQAGYLFNFWDPSVSCPSCNPVKITRRNP